MEIKDFLKQLNLELIKGNCSDIEFYEPKDFNELKQIYRIYFRNNEYWSINLYIVFDERNWLIKASNQNSLSYYLDLNGKTEEECEKIIEPYLKNPSILGLKEMKPSIQLGPILLLENVIDNDRHICITITKNKNLEYQSVTNFDCLFINSAKEFFSKFLPFWISERKKSDE
ncbi:hypothetical protein [Spiroplasma cantharicola]|uniref:Uncharacterized protein n=1 Tax=Spiroplasma cantharicola TaxID=362837 RepID=A0A0M4K1N1_9MOLU|nr:hypothetical protein [Spiroplasma cantharicola]ALD66537.1 hypothetical protein SCANT_v1c06310 [Spiroplasma cantharicola]